MDTTNGWTVSIETGDGDLATLPDEWVDNFAELMADYSGSCSFTPSGYGATFSLEDTVPANDPTERWSATRVATEAVTVFRDLAAKADLPELPIVRLEVLTFEEHDRELARPVVPELVGVSEIAGVLAVSRQRAHQITKRADFPTPIQQLAAGPVWTRPSLERFITEWHADKPDVRELVANVNTLIAELTNLRNHYVHDQDEPPMPSMLDLLEQARAASQPTRLAELLNQLVHDNAAGR